MCREDCFLVSTCHYIKLMLLLKMEYGKVLPHE